MIKLSHNMSYTTVTNEALKTIGFKPAKHSAISFISKGDKDMIVVENYQGDTFVESKVMLGKSSGLIDKLIDDCGYVAIYKGHQYLWRNVLIIQDTNNGHTVYLAKGAY